MEILEFNSTEELDKALERLKDKKVNLIISEGTPKYFLFIEMERVEGKR